MEKTTTFHMSAEFQLLAEKAVFQAFSICEACIAGNRSNITPELENLSAAALSLEKAVMVFLTAERLCK